MNASNVPETAAAVSHPIGSILVIEAGEALNASLVEVLRREGWDVHSARSGVEGLEKALSLPGALLIVDFSLPDLNGQEMLQWLAQFAHRWPFIILAGEDAGPLPLDLLQMEAQEFLVKGPDLLAQLPVVVRRVLESLRREDRLNQAETSLLARENYYRSILQGLHEGIAVIDCQYRVRDVNQAALLRLGVRREQALGETCHQLFHNHSRPCDEYGETCPLAEVLASGQSRVLRHRHASAAGSLEVEAIYSPLRLQPGQPPQVLLSARDLSELTAAEEQLRLERDRAQRYLDVASVFILVLDSRGRVTQLNRKGREILGATNRQVVGRDWFSTWLPADHRAEVRARFDQLLRGEVVAAEPLASPVQLPDGRQRWLRWHFSPLTERGRASGVIGSGEILPGPPPSAIDPG